MQGRIAAAAAAGVVGEYSSSSSEQQQKVKCPRCGSSNTKFCYYNNYNLSQPRHYCKNCRRYWTKGGSLRNIPVGGSTRKNTSNNKRMPSSPSNPPKRPTTTSTSTSTNNTPKYFVSDTFPKPKCPTPIDSVGSFSSLLHSNAVALPESSSSDGNKSAQPQQENFLGWFGDWPDLSIYTRPGSNFQ